MVTDNPAAYLFGHVVGLAALNMVQLWAELDVAGVGLTFARLMPVVSPCLRMLDLMRAYIPFCGLDLHACRSTLD